MIIKIQLAKIILIFNPKELSTTFLFISEDDEDDYC
jgi:hypothetical protein